MLEQLSTAIIHLIQTSGYAGIFILMALESCLIPIPSEVTMPFAGFLASTGNLSFVLVVFVGALGNLVGSITSYYIGYFLEENLLLNIIKKYGKVILVTERDYHTANKWFAKYGSGVVFFSRVLPAIRTFISLPAGMFGMNIGKFAIFTFIGSLIWSTVLTYVGYTLGKNWGNLGPLFRKFDIVIVILLILLVLLYINHKLKLLKLTGK